MLDDFLDTLRGLGSAAMYQFTDRVFEHFLVAVISVTLTGKITEESIIKIVTLLVLVYVAIEIHKKVDGTKPTESRHQIEVKHESPKNHDDYSI